MRYKVIISAQIDIEADSKEEAEIKARKKYNKSIDQNCDDFYLKFDENLEFDAILDSIQDEEIDSLDTKL